MINGADLPEVPSRDFLCALTGTNPNIIEADIDGQNILQAFMAFFILIPIRGANVEHVYIYTFVSLLPFHLAR